MIKAQALLWGSAEIFTYLDIHTSIINLFKLVY